MMKWILNCFLLLLSLQAIAQGSKKFYSKWTVPTQNSFAFKIGIPEGNYLYLNKGNQYGSSFGFLGLSLGFEYYFSNKYNINVDVGGLTDFAAPFPAPICYMGGYDKSSAIFADLQVGTDWKRFHFDAGIQLCRMMYIERETVSIFPEYIDTLKFLMEERVYGLAFSSYFRISKSFNVGLNYYPSFIVSNYSGTHSHYAHLLYIDLIFRIKWR
jgi:hypothetical protein